MIKILLLSLTLMSGFAAHADAAEDFKAAFRAGFAKLSPVEQARLEARMAQVGQQIERLNLIHQTGSEESEKWYAVVCVGMRAGLFVAGRGAVCMTHNGMRFLISIVGIEPYAGMSGDVVVGAIKGGPANGSYPLHFSASAHFKVGGSVLVAGPLVLFGPGVGVDLGFNGNIPADSGFGGHLVILRPY